MEGKAMSKCTGQVQSNLLHGHELQKVARFCLRDVVRNSDIQRELRVGTAAPWCHKEATEVVWALGSGCIEDTSP